MKALTYIRHGEFALLDKPKPALQSPRDAIVRVTLGSICTSDLHIKHGSVPRAVPGITVGHEMVGVVESRVPIKQYLQKFPKWGRFGVTSVTPFLLLPVHPEGCTPAHRT